MKIENDLTLVVVGPSTDNPTFIECYPVENMLRLREVADELSGHPGSDFDLLPGDGRPLAFGLNATKSKARQIATWLIAGRMVAIGYGRLSRRSRKRLVVTWRRPEDYLSEDELAWLEAYSETSELFVQSLRAAEAIGLALFKLAKLPKPKTKKPKTLAKERRRLAREEALHA